MGACLSRSVDKVEALRRVMEPRFADLLTRCARLRVRRVFPHALTGFRSDDALKAYVRAAFPAGLRESVPKEVLFGALRLEVGVLEDRLYTLLERARPGWTAAHPDTTPAPSPPTPPIAAATIMPRSLPV